MRHRSPKYRFAIFCIPVFCAALMSGSVHAQEAPKDGISFRFYRWQEDYLWLSRKTEPLTDYEHFKYMHLGGAPENYVSLGGELRYRYDNYRPYMFGLTKNGVPFGSDQERMLLHTDLHLSPYFRAFVQLDAATEEGRLVQRAYDRSDPDLRQSFADVILPAGDGKLMVRGGRQEIYLGPTRWMAVRDPTNIRRSFDGVEVEYKTPAFTVRAVDMRPVVIREDAFDDKTSEVENFRAVYAIAKTQSELAKQVDVYLLNREQDSVKYARGTAHDDRYTLGMRVAGKIAPLDYVLEGAHQYGSFGTADISSWGVFADVSRQFKDLRFTPRLGVRAHYASGDGNLKSGTMGTFVAPYPAASEIAEASIVSLSNIANVQPYAEFDITRGLQVTVNWNWMRKAEQADAIYAVGSGSIITAAGLPGLGLAQSGEVDFTWKPNAFLEFHGLYSHTFAEENILAAKGRDFDYWRLQTQVRF
jgi:hypothetical protein